MFFTEVKPQNTIRILTMRTFFSSGFYMCFGSDLCLTGQSRGRNVLIRNKIRFVLKNFTKQLLNAQ